MIINFFSRHHAIGRSLLVAGLFAVTAAPLSATPGTAQEVAGSATKPAADTRPDFSGYWAYQGFLSHVQPIDKRELRTMEGDRAPLQPWAQKIYDERLALQRSGGAWADTNSYCLPSGMPKIMMGSSYPMQLFQTDGVVLLVFEVMNEFRYIYIDQPSLGLDDLWEGESSGSWQGDTLVVNTIGITGKTTIDKIGMPHTADIKVTERFRLLDKDTLEVLVHMDDPKAFLKPWSVRTLYKRMPPDTRVMEYVCENQRNLPDGQGNSTIQLKLKEE